MSAPTRTGEIGLLQDLIRINSVGADEGIVSRHCALLLEAVDADVQTIHWEPNREQIVARVDGSGPPLTLAGHVDTVPARAEDWAVDPWAAEIDGARLVGRGSSDMKSGVAAMITAVVGHLRRPHACRGIQVVLTSGEETGCHGALRIPGAALLGGGPMVVAEPTANALVPAHKGAYWLALRARGRAAHGSAPELGDNAVVRLARAAVALHDHDGWPTDDRFGPVTANVGLLRGGVQPNVVPDSAELHLDLRTVPGAEPKALRDKVVELVGEDVDIDQLVDLPLIDTALEDPFLELVAGALSAVGLPGEPGPPARFFTDASALVGLLAGQSAGTPAAVPTVILGPGEPDQCHVVDEFCRIDRVEQATELYRELLTAWCEGSG